MPSFFTLLASIYLSLNEVKSILSRPRVVFVMTYFTETPVVVAAKSLQSCPTLCDPLDGNPPGSSVPGILQARTLEWVAISISKAWKWKVKAKSLSHVRLPATPWTIAHQAPPSMGFSRQEHWSGLPLPSPRHMLFPRNSISRKRSLGILSHKNTYSNVQVL